MKCEYLCDCVCVCTHGPNFSTKKKKKRKTRSPQRNATQHNAMSSFTTRIHDYSAYNVIQQLLALQLNNIHTKTHAHELRHARIKRNHDFCCCIDSMRE